MHMCTYYALSLSLFLSLSLSLSLSLTHTHTPTHPAITHHKTHIDIDTGSTGNILHWESEKSVHGVSFQFSQNRAIFQIQFLPKHLFRQFFKLFDSLIFRVFLKHGH